MNDSDFRVILDVKSAMLARDSYGVSLIREELHAAKKQVARIEDGLKSGADDFDTGDMLRAAVRFEAAQKERLADLRLAIGEIEGRLSVAEEKLKTALGEKRAVERLMS